MEHGFVSLLLTRGDTVAPSGLLARLCHAFLVNYVLFAVLLVVTSFHSSGIRMILSLCCNGVVIITLVDIYAVIPVKLYISNCVIIL